jgi:hypothetical protein
MLCACREYAEAVKVIQRVNTRIDTIPVFAAMAIELE